MGVKSKKKAKTRLDAYYRLAKEQGYRARSAFKLLQLNRKYDFLAKSRVLVDLCAAPGGWCQVAAKYMPVGSKIVGVDLVPIQPIRGVKTFVGDITDEKTRKIIHTWLKKEPVDCVIHDGAPNVGGVWSRDLYDQNALVLASAKMACSMLRQGGWFVTKVFRSLDFHKLLWVFKQLFEKVEATKPLASRMESAEIFVVCAGYLAPKQLDTEMFNPQKVFSDVGEEKIVSASGVLVTPKTNVPQGYDEFATVSHRVASFKDFIEARDPKTFLKTQHELRFSTDEEKAYLKSKFSKKELVYLCGDLQQVGDGDLRRLLRWREQLLRETEQKEKIQHRMKELRREAGEHVGDSDEDDVESLMGGHSGEDEEEELRLDLDDPESVTRIARELLELRKKKAKEIKKKQKKIVDRKLKQIKGLINYDPNAIRNETYGEDEAPGQLDRAGSALAGEEEEEGGTDGNLLDSFTVEKLAMIEEAEVGRLMDKAARPGPGQEEHGGIVDQDPMPLNPVVAVNLAAQEDWDFGEEDDDEDEDQELKVLREEQQQHSAKLVEGQEYFMDVDNYGNYIPAQRSARVHLFEGGLEDPEEEGDEESPEDMKKRVKKEKQMEKLDEAGKQSKWQRHHLNIDQVLNDTFPTVKDPKSSKRHQKNRKNMEEERITLSADHTLRLPEEKGARKRTRFEDGAGEDSDADDSDEDLFPDDDDVEGKLQDFEVNQGRRDSRSKRRLVEDTHELTTQEMVRQQRKQVLKDNKELRKQKRAQKQKGTKEDETFEEIPIALTDPTIRARTLAIAQKMLDPKARREVLDASVNRYMFDDDDDLPDWFIKDEQRNCRVNLPVTAEEMEEQRRRFIEMNARPSKKVAEALGRKRRRAQRLLHNLMEKGKSDPRAREKSNQLSVRTLMRAQVIKGQGKKKNKYLDSMAMGQMKRDRQKAKREKRRGGAKKKR